jgi:mono/diheme cytochrome c family protein
MRMLIAAGLVGLLLMLAMAALNFPLPPAPAVAAYQGDAKRGAYLARLSGCIACHSSKAGAPWAGGNPLVSKFGTFYAPNVTSHPQYGIGRWTFEQFVRAVRQGISPGGKPYYPSFPYEFYASLTDRDMADLWAAMQAIPPSAQASRRHEIGFPFSVRDGLRIWRPLFERADLTARRPDRTESWNVGQYLVMGPAHCAACHMPRNLAGGLDEGAGLAGDPRMLDGGKSPALSPEALKARGWTRQNLVAALRTGVLPNGDAFGGSMTEVVHESTAFLLNSHLEAMADYLLDLDE